MHLLTLSAKQAVILLPILLSLPINALASSFERRGNTCCGLCDDDENGNQLPTLDGPTTDQSAGIGVEFEAGTILFAPKGTCPKAEIDKSKGALVDKRQGTNWMLTTDTSVSDAGYLTAEYILNGKPIKIGSGDAATAASAVANDITSWNPSNAITDDVTVQGSTCNPWKIAEPDPGGQADQIRWATQVTAPLPLEAISDLFSKAVTKTSSALLPTRSPERNMVWVTRDFFQSNPNTISAASVNADVLGFFSLILSYAKNAKRQAEDDSPKMLTSIMPRTEFTTIFAQVKSKVPLNPNTLYELVKVLACYKNNAGGDGVALDSDYCTGTVTAPVPNTKMDSQTFIVNPSEGQSQSLTVQDWIQSIQDGTSPDKLSVLDQAIDGSIGGLGNALENVINSNPSRAVPLFEFRRLPGVQSGGMQNLVTSAETAVIQYHQAGVNPPRFLKKRTNGNYAHIKRQACPTALPATTTPAPPPPPPPPPSPSPSAGPDADSCDVSYKVVFDEFQIRGKNFDASKIGTDGSGLEKQIKGCGDLTKWNFQMTPTDPTYQWYASGHLPIGVKDCVGRAVISGGGATIADCHGPG